MPHRYPAGVTSLPDPWPKPSYTSRPAQPSCLARTRSPITEQSRVDGQVEPDAGSTAALDRDNGDFGYFPTLFGYRQNGLAVLTRGQRQDGDACSTLPKSDVSSGFTTGQCSLMTFKISQQELAIAFLRCDQSRTFVGDPLQGIYCWWPYRCRLMSTHGGPRWHARRSGLDGGRRRLAGDDRFETQIVVMASDSDAVY